MMQTEQHFELLGNFLPALWFISDLLNRAKLQGRQIQYQPALPTVPMVLHRHIDHQDLT